MLSETSAGNSLGAALRQARQSAGLTQEELAARTGLSVRAIGDLERGRTARPHSRSVHLIAQALGLPESAYNQLTALLRQQAAALPGPARPSGLAARTQASGEAGGPVDRLVPAQLPTGLADFTGRAEQVACLQQILTGDTPAGGPGAVTVAVVAGAGGTGKSALAVHVAHLIQDSFPDGQFFAELGGAGPHPAGPAEMLARFLRDLGVPPDRIPVSVAELGAQYRSHLAGRRVLIVLDDARDAAQVQPLLPGSAPCAVLVTSRRWLSDLAGCSALDLDVFAPAEAWQLFATMVGPDRVAAEREASDELLRACAGLPLAIRVAGARLAARSGWTVRTMADRLADERQRLDQLTAGSLAVRASFEVGVAALPAPDRAAGVDPAHTFRMLGLWPGPAISLDAAAALLGRPRERVADALEALVDARLLQSPAPDCYQFHDLLKVHAANKVLAEESQEARDRAVRRLVTWYLHSVAAVDRIISPYRNQLELGKPEVGCEPLSFASVDEALDWCERERANLVAGTRLAAAVGLHDIAWQLPVAALSFFNRRRYCHEWVDTHQIALRSARQIGDQRAEAWVLNNLGMAFARQGQEESVEFLRQALVIRRDIGDQTGEAQVANNLSYACLLAKRFDEALEWGQVSLDLHRTLGHRFGEGVALNNVGEAFLELGRPEAAIDWLRQALDVYREIGVKTEAADTLSNLGRASVERGCLADAMDYLRQAEQTYRAVGHQHGEAVALDYLGDVYAQDHRTGDAAQAWNRALTIFEALGDDTRVRGLRERLAMLPR